MNILRLISTASAELSAILFQTFSRFFSDGGLFFNIVSQTSAADISVSFGGAICSSIRVSSVGSRSVELEPLALTSLLKQSPSF